MSTHNVCFYGEIRKIFCEFPLVCSYGFMMRAPYKMNDDDGLMFYVPFNNI